METLLAPKHNVHESSWSGSRIVFDRHGHASKKRTVSVKPKCNVCSKTFFNDSSLKRHAKIH